MSPRPWMVALVLVVASLAIGYGLGRRQPAPVVAPTDVPTETKPPPSGIHVEAIPSAENLFSMAGLKAVLFRYRGGPVEFWIEREVDGKTEKVGESPGWFRMGDDLPGARKAPADSVESGYFVWTRREATGGISETWTLAHRREMISGTSSVLRTGIPLGEITLTHANEQTDARTSSSNFTQVVWSPPPPPGRIAVSLVASLVACPSLPGVSSAYQVALAQRQFHDEQQATHFGASFGTMTFGDGSETLSTNQPVRLRHIEEYRRLSPWREQRQVFRVMARVMPPAR